MLTPDDRMKAIDILVDYYQNGMCSHYNTNFDTKKLLLSGFKGFAAFTDEEITRALRKISDKEYRAAEMLKELVDFELLK
jgi:hypothetical protein